MSDWPETLCPHPVGALPRNDLVVYFSHSNRVGVVQGLPNACPCDPPLPAGAVVLGRLRFRAFAQLADVDTLVFADAPPVPDDRHRAFPDG